MKAIKNDPTGIHTHQSARIIAMYPQGIYTRDDHQGWRTRIALPTADGVHLIDMRNILYCSADGNYTQVHLVDGTRLIISKTLGTIDQQLSEKEFIRVHQSYLVRLDKIDCLQTEKIILEGSITIPVSRSRRAVVRHTLLQQTCQTSLTHFEIH